MFRDYVVEGRQWDVEIPEEVIMELRNTLNPETNEIDIPLDDNLFSSLYFFVLDVLEGYYKDF